MKCVGSHVVDYRWNFKDVDSVFLVDVSWVLYKNYHALPNLSITSPSGPIRTGHLFGTLRLVQLVLTRVTGIRPVVVLCVDSYPEIRHTIFPGYKLGRVHGMDLKKATLDLAKMAGALDRVCVVSAKGQEADDLIFSVAQDVGPEKTYVFSGDNDLLQMVKGNVRIVRQVSAKGLEILDAQEYCRHKWAVDLKDVLYYRILTGDTSDNIPRVYGDRDAKLIMAEYPTVEEFLESDSAKGNNEALMRNYKLMKLERVDYSVWKSEFNTARSTAVEFKMNSFLKVLEGEHKMEG